ncbi:MAG: type 1 glutamine amidotransferase domain-containing protein [Halobacteriovoraceae bacterium]|nr:type 1 glutamine amidotransferase domain-containing protein [Halobacteriovoraceae bacterium]|tara:strand:+ start:144558 stop:145244 length:687 start_codon:yes stop_codon:yes gene_type:complete
MAGKKVLIVLTSHDQLGDTGEKTGFWLEEFAAPYYAFKDAGYQIDLASPKGGRPPMDPKSDTEDTQTDDTKRFKNDQDAQDHLDNTKILASINPEDYDTVFYPGGHGPMWDLAYDKDSINIIESFNKKGKFIGAVCHAPAALLNAKGNDGNSIVAGKKVTAFTNSEEEEVGLKDDMPYLLENRLKDLGGNYQKKGNWKEFTIKDGNLITGQNPASSKKVAQNIIESLQ